MKMSLHSEKLREIIARNSLTPVASAYDALSAKLVESAGFEVVHVGGYNLSASLLGLPDVGLMTMSEMVQAVRRIVDTVEVPIIADGDDGYGNYLNISRLIRELERSRV